MKSFFSKLAILSIVSLSTVNFVHSAGTESKPNAELTKQALTISSDLEKEIAQYKDSEAKGLNAAKELSEVSNSLKKAIEIFKRLAPASPEHALYQYTFKILNEGTPAGAGFVDDHDLPVLRKTFNDVRTLQANKDVFGAADPIPGLSFVDWLAAGIDSSVDKRPGNWPLLIFAVNGKITLPDDALNLAKAGASDLTVGPKKISVWIDELKKITDDKKRADILAALRR